VTAGCSFRGLVDTDVQGALSDRRGDGIVGYHLLRKRSFGKEGQFVKRKLHGPAACHNKHVSYGGEKE